MEHHRRQPWVAVTALGLVAIAVGVTWVTPASPQDHAESVQRVAFSKDKKERATDLDLGKKGPSAGDRIVTRGPFFDASDRSLKVGSYVGELVTFNPRTLLTQLTLTATFPEGQLSVVGSLPFRQTLRTAGATLPITGGTRAYRGASGTVTIRARKLGRDDGFLFDFDIAVR